MQPYQQPSGRFWLNSFSQTQLASSSPWGSWPYLWFLVGRRSYVVHDLHEVGGALLAHLALGVVVHDYLAVQLEADALDLGGVGRVVEVRPDAAETADQGPDLLVAQNGAYAATPGLLDADALTPLVVKAEVEDAHRGVVGTASRAHHGDRLQVLLIPCKCVGEFLGQEVGIVLEARRGFVELHGAFI